MDFFEDVLSNGVPIHRAIITRRHRWQAPVPDHCYPSSVPTIEVRNPATGKLAGTVGSTSEDELRSLVSKARNAQKTWAGLGFQDRCRVIARFHDLALERSDRIFDTIQSETGKTRRDALAELVTVAGTARYYVAHGRRHLSPHRKRGALPVLTASAVEYRPHGVVGLITPWNYPFILAIGDAIPALLAGNAVLLKPSELTPLSAMLGKELLLESGLDPQLLAIANGGADVGGAVVRNVDYVGFTGGTASGRKVAIAAAERLIPFSLELGGKNPMVILKDAPLEQAAQALLAGAFCNSGQTCIAIERVYVEEPVYGRFAELVGEKTRGLKVGWSSSWDMDVGSLIHERHATTVQKKIEDAVHSGAVVIAGGKRRQDLGPAFVEPTVLANLDPRAPIETTETFGPVVSLHRVRNAEEAIALSNDSDYGLNASVWAGGTAAGMDVARQINAGSVGINSTLMVYNAFDVPMGGIKQSGIGRRHGEQGILRYTQPQSIVTSFAAAGGYDSVLMKVRDERLAGRLLRLTRLWRRIPWVR
jgi:acyl-CoA reductase-like NAD-dependent aldehyde dehydrogenase